MKILPSEFKDLSLSLDICALLPNPFEIHFTISECLIGKIQGPGCSFP